jgi:hypothetical protein
MAWWTERGTTPRPAPIEVEDGNLKIFPVVGVTLLSVAIPAALCLGARLQREQDAAEIARLRERIADLSNELQVADDAWADCILDDPIRFPGETTLRIAVAP